MQHDRIAGRFLVKPEGAVGIVRNRVPPMQRKDRQRGEINRDIVSIVMRQFMGNSQPLLRSIIPVGKILGDNHGFAENTECNR